MAGSDVSCSTILRRCTTILIEIVIFGSLLAVNLIGRADTIPRITNWKWVHGWPVEFAIRWGWRSNEHHQLPSKTSRLFIDFPRRSEVSVLRLVPNTLIIAFLAIQAQRYLRRRGSESNAYRRRAFSLAQLMAGISAVCVVIALVPFAELALDIKNPYFNTRFLWPILFVPVAGALIMATFQTVRDIELFFRPSRS